MQINENRIHTLRPTEQPETLQLETESLQPLTIGRDDPACSAVKDVINGANVLFAGVTGAGKSERAFALLNPVNYQRILSLSGMDGIKVEIDALHVNLIPVLTNAELVYERGLENGTTFKKNTAISEFIAKHGYKTRKAFLAAEEERRKVLRTKQGTIRIKAIVADDFDRAADVSITNAFMRQINDSVHLLPSGEKRYLKLQCLATSNSCVGRPGSGYIASRGIDTAIANRFQIYQLGRADICTILGNEFPMETQPFIEKISRFVENVIEEQGQGAFAGIGEITLRQVRNIVQLFADGFETEKGAALKLLAGVGEQNEEREKADYLIDTYFGNQGRKKQVFGRMF